jgi:hypothetical protein
MTTLFLLTPLAAQILVVDRPILAQSAVGQPVERAAGFYGDAFRVGAAGETWMIDTIRLWGIASGNAACPKELGDQIEKLTLLGALDNPAAPGQPVCDCHALVAIATAPLSRAGSSSSNPAASLTFENGTWRIDFRDVRWSVPGDADVLFSLRASARKPDRCQAAADWKLASGPAAEGYRLRALDKAGVPEGLADPRQPPRSLGIQVWAHRTHP